MPCSCAVYSGFSDLPGRQPCHLPPALVKAVYCLVGSSHVVCASISGCVGAVCWHLKHAVVALPHWKSLHVCRETVLFSPLSLYHLRAAPHDANGLFSFLRRVRQNPKVVNVQSDVWRMPYLICHRVDHSQS